MLVQRWDAARDPFEWRRWLESTERFGMLVVNNVDPAHAPLVVPTHFTIAGDELLLHLARTDPLWPHLEAFKYDDHEPVEHRARISDELESRDEGLDARAAAQQRRRIADNDASRPDRPK